MQKISTDVKKRQKYFYAKQASELYDDTIGLVCPFYDIAQEMMFEFISMHLKDCKGIKWVLDIGAGTGAESIKIMKLFDEVNVVAIDFTKEMKKVYEKNILKNTLKNDGKRYLYLVEDVLSKKITPDFLLSHIRDKDSVKKYTAAVSAYTIHHYSLKEKISIYQKVYNSLEDGGVFVNIDLYNYVSKIMSRVSHQAELQWITNQFENPDKKYDKARKISKKDRQVLSTAWINHYNYDNILHTVEKQVDILRKVGFKDVESPYRYYENGLIWAKK